MVEQRPFKALVEGSSPSQPTTLKTLKHNGFQSERKRESPLDLLGGNCRFLSFFGLLSVFIGNLLVIPFLDVTLSSSEC